MRTVSPVRMVVLLLLVTTIGAANAMAGGRFFHRRDCTPCPPCCQQPCQQPTALEAAPVPELRFRSVTPERIMREAAANNFAEHLPFIAVKPTPQGRTFNNCPARGDDRGDQDLNFLKNRIDVADAWIPVGFNAVLNQSFPRTVGRRDRSRWTAEDLAAVQKYEGIPISIVGYFVWAKDEDKESCNCHIDDKSMFDIHTWLTKAPVEARDRTHAIVAEVTPRLKPEHPNWTQAKIRKLAREKKKVRVSGWLLLDQEHPEQLDDTRGTLWEIHPIMQIEVWENEAWLPLDNLQSSLKSNFLYAAA
jgi:hypothetical protein